MFDSQCYWKIDALKLSVILSDIAGIIPHCRKGARTIIAMTTVGNSTTNEAK